MSSVVRTERNGKVLEITMDRSPVNAINTEMSMALYDAFATLRDDPTLTVGLITGSGERCFSAGWDLKEAADSFDGMEAPETLGMSPGGFAGFTEMWDLYKPVIAAVNAHAIGGGLEVALASDIVFSVPEAEFWLPEMDRGFLPDAGAVQRLPKKIPHNVALEMMYTGRHMTAEEACRWGFVHRVLPRAELMDAAREMAAHISTGAPLALQALKETFYGSCEMPVDVAFDNMSRDKGTFPIYEKVLDSEDFKEGPRAFAEKRTPVWKGR